MEKENRHFLAIFSQFFAKSSQKSEVSDQGRCQAYSVPSVLPEVFSGNAKMQKEHQYSPWIASMKQEDSFPVLTPVENYKNSVTQFPKQEAHLGLQHLSDWVGGYQCSDFHLLLLGNGRKMKAVGIEWLLKEDTTMTDLTVSGADTKLRPLLGEAAWFPHP